jgi:hypothetical protein
VAEPEPSGPLLDVLHGAAGHDRDAALLELAGEPPRHLGEVDDPGDRRMQRRHPATVRLDLAQLAAGQPPQRS